MPQSLINQLEYISIKEDLYEELIFADINWIALEVYNNDFNTHDATAGVDKNYTNYNSNNASYEDSAKYKEDGATDEYGSGTNSTHEDGSIYLPTPVTNNPPDNYEIETMYNNAVDETPVMLSSEETSILDAIENDIAASTIEATAKFKTVGM